MTIQAPQFQSLIKPTDGDVHFLNLAHGTETLRLAPLSQGAAVEGFKMAKGNSLAKLIAGGAEAPPPPASMPGVNRFSRERSE